MMRAPLLAVVAACLLSSAAAQPFQTGQGLVPLGNLRTTDRDGPYNITLLDVQTVEIQAAESARQNFTDRDVLDFLSQLECFEGLFDTYGTFGRGFLGGLEFGSPKPIGARKAKLTERTLPFMQEVALNEQGHALFTRQAGSILPCPLIDYEGGFNKFMAAAFKLNGTVKDHFGEPFDFSRNDVNFVLSVLSLEELGATGNKGLAGLVVNPVHSNAIAGLATSATAQATVERFLLYQMRNEIVHPFNETAQQVFARMSALRDHLDGPQFDDQGIVNTDDRNIALPDSFVNLVPTDVRGLTFSRTPQMNINILTLGAKDGKGGFFPEGIHGKINKPTGYNKRGVGLADYSGKKVAPQQPKSVTKPVPKPITGSGPSTVPGVQQLTQVIGRNKTTTGAAFRGFFPINPRDGDPNDDGPPAAVGTIGGTLSPSSHQTDVTPPTYDSPATSTGSPTSSGKGSSSGSSGRKLLMA